MTVGTGRFPTVEQKTFDIVEEGKQVRIYENGKGFRKPIFYRKEEVE